MTNYGDTFCRSILNNAMPKPYNLIKYCVSILLILYCCCSYAAEFSMNTTKTYPYFNTRLGCSGMNMEYKFTVDKGLIEMAKQQVNMGSDAFKFVIGPRYRELYFDMKELPPGKRDT